MALTKLGNTAFGTSAVLTASIKDNAVTYNKLNANTAHYDRVNTFTAGQKGTITNLGVYHGLAGNTVTLSLGTSNHYSLTSNANLTFANPTLTNVVGQCGSIIITANGNFTGSWGSYWRFASGTAPTLSANTTTQTPPYQDRIDYFVVSSNTIHAVATTNLAGTA